MIFKSIWFSNTDEYKCLQKKLVNKKISFFIINNDRPWKGKIANIVVLIGENGIGKTSLLSCLKKLFCMLKKSIKNVDMNKCSLHSNLLHNGHLKNTIINDLFSDRNYLYTNFYTKEKWYSVRYNFSNILPENDEILQLCRQGYKWKEIETLYEKIDCNFSDKKNPSWDEDFCDYDKTKFLFFKDSDNYFQMLEIVKNEIKIKYFNEYLEMEKKLEDVNKVSEENKKQNIHSLKTNFKLLTDELYRITKIRIKENNEKNKDIIISENDTNYDLSNLSSGQKKYS